MANGWGFGAKTPVSNTYQSPNRRLSQLLLQGQIGQPRQQRRGKTGQIADFLQSGLGAYLATKDMGQQQAAQEAFIKGASGEGGMTGATAALQSLSGNPYAQNRLQNLLMKQISQSQKEKQRLKELGSERETYQFQQEHKAFAPKVPVPGKDVPFSEEVQSQLVERAQATKPSWDQMPGVPGMMVSSTGQMQAVPQTPQQAAQTKLETEAAQAQAEAKRAFPQVEQKAQETLTNIEALMAHPGLPGVIGVPDTLAGAAYKMFDVAPVGTKEADFTARLDQLGGQQFLQAFESLKGGGAITEVEGKKATNAMSRLTKTGQSEASYRQAGEELKTVIRKGLNRARATAGIGQAPIGQAPIGQAPIGQLLKPEIQAMLSPGGLSAMPPGLQIPPGVRGGQVGGPDLMSMYGSPSTVGAVPPGVVLQGQQLPSNGVAQISNETEYNALPPGALYSVSGGKAKRKR